MIILIQKSLFEFYLYRLTFSHKRKFYNKLKVETLKKALQRTSHLFLSIILSLRICIT